MSRYRRGDWKSIATSAGIVECRDIGSGDPVVFVHGAFLNGALWDDVVFYLPPDLRLVRPDLPLGGHRLPAAADADLTPPALAGLLLDIVTYLGLHDVTLAASDGGEAICWRAVASGDERARRISRLLLTNCDPFDQHAPWQILGSDTLDETILDGVAAALSTCEGRKAFFERLAWAPVPDEQVLDLLGGFIDSAAVRRDALRALLGATHAHPPAPGTFDGPVKILWGVDDLCLPVELGERLAATFHDAELHRLHHARLLVPLDQPEVVAEALIEMLERARVTHH